jgi:hypothetical protein
MTPNEAPSHLANRLYVPLEESIRIFRQSEEIQLPAELDFNFNIPPHFNVIAPHYSLSFVSHASPAIDSLCIEMRGVAETLSRHEGLIQEILEMVKVIEVETRKLSPDPIHDVTDAAESGLNEILLTIRENRFPPQPSPEVDALLSQALERRQSISATTSPASEELAIR